LNLKAAIVAIAVAAGGKRGTTETASGNTVTATT
jgi:hypothetical protein